MSISCAQAGIRHVKDGGGREGGREGWRGRERDGEGEREEGR